MIRQFSILLGFLLVTGCASVKSQGEQYAYQDLVGNWEIGERGYEINIDSNLTTIKIITEDGVKSSDVRILNSGIIMLNKKSNYGQVRVIKKDGIFYICNSDNENCEPMTKKD